MIEYKGLLIACQIADEKPADWEHGDDVIVPAPGSCGVAKDRMESSDKDVW